MAGIQRVKIEKEGFITPVLGTLDRGRGYQRFTSSERHWAAANAIYRHIFQALGSPLELGYELIVCKNKGEARARFDWQLGVDVILQFENGMRSTLQEKFLFPVPKDDSMHEYRTVTIEYMQNPQTDEQGDWFNMSVQYYFVGNSHNREEANFWEWALYNYADLQLKLAKGELCYEERDQRFAGARASFRFVYRDQIPLNCLVADSFGYLRDH